MNNADLSDLLTVADDSVKILRVNIIQTCLLCRERKALVLDVVNRNRNHTDKLEIKRFCRFCLAEQGDCKLFMLTAKVIFVNAVNSTSYLENSE